MSGHFTQRGDVAVASKWARAAMALRHGADLVVELPLTFALAPAERFARGGVALLHALGCVDALSFGSETGRLEPLLEVASLLESGGSDGDIRRFLTQGISYAKAREQAVRSQLGAAAECLTQPNDTLGIEYLRALSSLHCVMRPLVIPRRGARHDEQGERDGFRSASHLRTLWQQGAFMPEHLSEESREILLTEHRCGRFPVFCSGLEPILLGLLRSAERGRYTALPDLSEGLENRLWRAVRQGCSLDEIHDPGPRKAVSSRPHSAALPVSRAGDFGTGLDCTASLFASAWDEPARKRAFASCQTNRPASFGFRRRRHCLIGHRGPAAICGRMQGDRFVRPGLSPPYALRERPASSSYKKRLIFNDVIFQKDVKCKKVVLFRTIDLVFSPAIGLLLTGRQTLLGRWKYEGLNSFLQHRAGTQRSRPRHS